MTTEFQSRLSAPGERAADAGTDAGTAEPVAAENDRLRGELDALRNGAVERWLTAALQEGWKVREFESSLSWRVTRPLRVGGMVTRSVRDIGVVPTARLAVARLRRSRG